MPVLLAHYKNHLSVAHWYNLKVAYRTRNVFFLPNNEGFCNNTINIIVLSI